MTSRLIFEATLIELSKIKAPALKLYEFNYLFNKAINLYINKIYNIYDVNQQTSDDLRVLKDTAYLVPVKYKYGQSTPVETGSGHPLYTNPNVSASSYLSSRHSSIASLHGATYEVFLPENYMHILNCICVYKIVKLKDCYNAGSYIEVPATRLTADSWSQVIDDIYNRPTPMRPYFYLHQTSNVNNFERKYEVTSSDSSEGESYVTISTYVNGDTKAYLKDGKWYSDEQCVTELPSDFDSKLYTFESSITKKSSVSSGGGSNFKRTFNTENGLASLVEKPIATRISNVQPVRLEIRYGRDDSVFLLAEVQIDYIKSPLFIRLTLELIDLTEDTSQMMEFPDYVNQEIINELVHLVMMRSSDPTLQNHIKITSTVAQPTQQLSQ